MNKSFERSTQFLVQSIYEKFPLPMYPLVSLYLPTPNPCTITIYITQAQYTADLREADSLPSEHIDRPYILTREYRSCLCIFTSLYYNTHPAMIAHGYAAHLAIPLTAPPHRGICTITPRPALDSVTITDAGAFNHPNTHPPSRYE